MKYLINIQIKNRKNLINGLKNNGKKKKSKEKHKIKIRMIRNKTLRKDIYMLKIKENILNNDEYYIK